MIFQWILEFIYWFSNVLTVAIPFIGAGSISKSGKHSTLIVIVSPSFTGPALYIYAKRKLEKLGFRVLVINFAHPMRNLETAAPLLKAEIEQLGTTDICLVAISSAGLVVYEYLNLLNGWNNVKNFVALAVPFKGTHMGYFMYHQKAGRQLLPHSRYIQKVGRIEPKNLNRTYCIVAAKDELVPRWSSTLKGTHTLVMTTIGHVRLHAYSAATFQAIAKIAKNK